MCFLLFALTAITQVTHLDSLKAELKRANHDTTICSLYIKIGEAFDDKNTDSVFYYLYQSLELAQKKKLSKKMSSAYTSLGSHYRRRGNYEKSLENLLNALKIDDELNDKLGLSKNYNNIGLIHRDKGNYDLALEMFNKSLEIKEQLGDRKGVAATNVNIGMVYRSQGYFEKSIEQYHKSMKILEELNDKDGVSKCLNNIGNVHYSQKNFDKALEYFIKSLEIVEKIGDARGLARMFNNIGVIYREKGDYEKAIEYYEKSTTITIKLGDKRTLANTYNNLGNLYRLKKEYNIALDHYLQSKTIRDEIGDKQGLSSIYVSLAELYNLWAFSFAGEMRLNYLNNAKRNGELGFDLANEIGALPDKNSAAQALKETYTLLKDYKKALHYANIILDIKETLFGEEKVKALTEVEAKYQSEKKQQEIERQQLEIEKNKIDYQRQRIRLNFAIVGSIMLALLALSVLLAYRQKYLSSIIIREKNALLEQYNEEIRATSEALVLQNEQLKEQNDEIQNQRNSLANLAWELQEKSEEVEKQKNVLANQHKEITDSIVYARRIQNAVLPTSEFINNLFSEHFILYKPKSIVSGDFYWATQINDLSIFCVTDCTGHGVPGAFMSMMGISFLNEIVRKEEVTDAAQVLNQLRNLVITSMVECNENHIKLDGMDMGLCVLNRKSLELQFAGANIPCWIAKANISAIKNDERFDVNDTLIEIKPDRMPIARFEKMDPFTLVNIRLDAGDTIYLATDGFADQFGGAEGKKFQKNRVLELISQVKNEPLRNQKDILDITFEKWKGSKNQIDDVTILGVKI